MSFAELKKEWMNETTVEFYGIGKMHLNKVWFEIKPYIEKCIRDPEFEVMDEIYDLISDGSYQLWIGADMAYKIKLVTITELVSNKYTGAKRLNIKYTGGEGMEKWVHFLHVYLKNFAMQANCTSMQIIGRRGWLKVLPEYKADSTIMTTTLRN